MAEWDSDFEVVEDDGVIGRDKEVVIDKLVESRDEFSAELDDAALVVGFGTVPLVTGGEPTSTVVDGRILKVGIVLLSIRVNDRDIEVDPVEVDGALVLEAIVVDDERASVIENELSS